MKIQGIIHQQICQLRWHLLACLGMIMVLPIEEAIVNLREGDGFHSVRMVYAAIAFSPLLAGLIACANVQGDLNEKRYIFWRSKPANVKRLMALKFFVGLIVSLAIIACPLVFGAVSSALCGEDLVGKDLKYFVPIPFIIAVMTYSLCFGCNVLVRNTARSWLIGMLLAGFVLVFPFMLPLGYTDIVSDIGVWAFGFYPAIILIASASGFLFALYATQHDWHLKTNLKGLLWVAAGLVFVLTILFSSQVANIKLLGEKETTKYSHESFVIRMDRIESRVTLKGRSYVDIDNNNISFTDICDVPTRGIASIPQSCLDIANNIFFTYIRDAPTRGIANIPLTVWLFSRMYPDPWYGSLYKKAGDDVYFLTIHAFYQKKFDENFHTKDFYEKVYLRSYRLGGDSRIPVSELDLSDFLAEETTNLRVEMRLINDTLIAFLNDSYIVVDATNPGELKQTERKLNVLKIPLPSYYDRLKEFALPIVPVDGISIEERIKLSIDRNYRSRHYGNSIYDASIVDVQEGKIAFVLVSGKDIARFDVVRWDREKMYCKFGTARPFTIIEGMTGGYSFERVFVKNGSLYCYGNGQLMVFDIRSKHKIRKLGHFARMDYGIEDIEVLDNGNILLGVREPHGEKRYLYLLENPG